MFFWILNIKRNARNRTKTGNVTMFEWGTFLEQTVVHVIRRMGQCEGVSREERHFGDVGTTTNSGNDVATRTKSRYHVRPGPNLEGPVRPMSWGPHKINLMRDLHKKVH